MIPIPEGRFYKAIRSHATSDLLFTSVSFYRIGAAYIGATLIRFT